MELKVANFVKFETLELARLINKFRTNRGADAMKKRFFSSAQIFLLVLFTLLNKSLFGQKNFNREKITLLKVIAGIHFTFKYYSNEIWPGYDLSEEPFVAYMPNDFVLFVNGKRPPEGFKPYPTDWAKIGARAFIHYGVYRNLVGQFAFNFQIDSVTTFAMGLPKNLLFSLKNPSYTLLSTTIHEGFHQYQHTHFGEIPWAREELYPILDLENTALASLEMQILKKSLDYLFAPNNENRLKTLAKEFAAVRNYRWNHAESFVKKYEQGQEINEGTARYVEMKAMECFLKLDPSKIQNKLLREIKADMSGESIKNLLLSDMNARLNGLSVSPENMLRNRIYPVGATLGFLMDRFGIDWKGKFQAAGGKISFLQLLKERFNLDSTELSELFEKAKKEFNYSKILSSAESQINEYFAEYKKALQKFNNQKGIRIEIRLSNNGIQRFRSTKSKKWVVDNGKKLLCLDYNLYSLKSLNGGKTLLVIRDKAVFDVNDWKTRNKKVVFYCDSPPNLKLNDSTVTFVGNFNRDFKEIKLTGNNFKFTAKTKGKITFEKKGIKIFLNI